MCWVCVGVCVCVGEGTGGACVSVFLHLDAVRTTCVKSAQVHIYTCGLNWMLCTSRFEAILMIPSHC